MSASDWISVIALLFSVGALLWNYNIQRKEKEPKLFLQRKLINQKVPKAWHHSWRNNEYNGEYFSDISIDLINLGESSAFIDRYYFILDNATEIQEYFDSKNLSPLLRIPDVNYSEGFPSSFTLRYGDDVNALRILDDTIYSNLAYGSPVASHNVQKIYLPEYFFMFTNAILSNNKSLDKNFLPVLRLFVVYLDIHGKEYKKQHLIKWGGSQSLSFDVSGQYSMKYNSNIISEKIK